MNGVCGFGARTLTHTYLSAPDRNQAEQGGDAEHAESY